MCGEDDRLEHLLTKEEERQWFCQACRQSWGGKPRSECPGVPLYDASDVPEGLVTQHKLLARNLKTIGEPVGCIPGANKSWIWLYQEEDTDPLHPYPIVKSYNSRELKTASDMRCLNLAPKNAVPKAMIWSGADWKFLYALDECEIDDPEMPPIYDFSDRPDHLKSPSQLPRFNLAPGSAPRRGAYWLAEKSKWVYLYDPKDEGFEILDPSLPHCYPSWLDVPAELKTRQQWITFAKRNVIQGAKPAGCYREFTKTDKYYGDWVTVFLYAIDQTEPIA